ncbi:MAG: amidohydrolase family protein [Caldilineaceae bacterium]|nr:amidohydrolase family protein [Caldilineaceae bacterium]
MIRGKFVIDAHCHLGQSLLSGVDISEEGLLATMRGHGIDVALVMPQPFQGLEVVAIHDRIARLAEAQPGAIYGMANVSCRLPEADYRREVTRCIRDLGFKAIKIDPSVHAVAPNHPVAEIVFATAQELGVPVIIHTGLGAPFALPALAIPPALKYPDLTIVLAHAGYGVYYAEALVAAQVCPNIILEHSWSPSFQVEAMTKSLGADRVMFGSDHLTNVAPELAKLHAIGLDDNQLSAILGGTARRVFHLD